MTEHHFHGEPSSKNTANPVTSRQITRVLVTGGLLTAALVGAVLGTQPSGLAHRTSGDSHRSPALAAADPTKIVPADVHGTGEAGRP